MTGPKVHLAMSYPGGVGGLEPTINDLRAHLGPKVHLATWPPEKQPEQAQGQAMIHNAGPKVHIVDGDPQHYSWASRSAGDELRLRVLLSYHYYKDTDLDALFRRYFTEPYPEVFIDSGAFSADTQGVPIDLRAYIAYIKRYRHLITTYSNLDVIRNPEATWANQQRMEDAGLSPLPVFHGGTPWQWLEHYIERYPYIALGGLVGKIGRAKAWLVRCFQMAKGRSVFHGFGVTAWDVLRDLPWYSVDSSSWGQGFRFGEVPLFDERRGTWAKVNLGDRRGWLRHAGLVRTLGFDPADFADRSRNDRAKVAAISALSYMLAERYLRKRHGPIHIPDRPDLPPGLNLHLVTADSSGPTGSNMGQGSIAEGMTLIDGEPHPRPAGLRLHLADANVHPDTAYVPPYGKEAPK